MFCLAKAEVRDTDFPPPLSCQSLLLRPKWCEPPQKCVTASGTEEKNTYHILPCSICLYYHLTCNFEELQPLLAGPHI